MLLLKKVFEGEKLAGQEFRVRNANINDLQKLKALYATSESYMRPSPRDLRKRLGHNPKHFFVAEKEGEVVGAIYSIVAPKEPSLKEIAEAETENSLANLHSKEVAANPAQYENACFYIASLYSNRKTLSPQVARLLVNKQLAHAKKLGFTQVRFIAKEELWGYFMRRFSAVRDPKVHEIERGGVKNRVAWFTRRI